MAQPAEVARADSQAFGDTLVRLSLDIILLKDDPFPDPPGTVKQLLESGLHARQLLLHTLADGLQVLLMLDGRGGEVIGAADGTVCPAAARAGRPACDAAVFKLALQHPKLTVDLAVIRQKGTCFHEYASFYGNNSSCINLRLSYTTNRLLSRGKNNARLLDFHNLRLYTKQEVRRMYADRIRYFRQKQGLSQQALGELLGVSATAVHKWEHGQSQPDIPALQRMSAIFGVSIDELCDHQPPAGQEDANVVVMTRAFRQLTAEEQEKYLAVGRALFAHAFGKGGDRE